LRNKKYGYQSSTPTLSTCNSEKSLIEIGARLRRISQDFESRRSSTSSV
jgi:hypothetical protein